jgi:hypothetical protein
MNTIKTKEIAETHCASAAAIYSYRHPILVLTTPVLVVHISIGCDNNVGHHSKGYRLSGHLLVWIAAHCAMLA